jgi:hypothetical protein
LENANLFLNNVFTTADVPLDETTLNADAGATLQAVAEPADSV